MKNKLNAIIASALKNNWTLNAFSDYEGSTYTYADVAKRITLSHRFFKEIGIEPGDKVLLLGRNSANWAVSYLTIVSYGAVVVPVLPDFKADDIYYIVNHSESQLLIVSDAISNKLDVKEMSKVEGIVSLDDYSITWEKEGQKLAQIHKEISQYAINLELKRESLKLGSFSNDSLGVLSYTSGTTGFSKGVMISRNSVVSNIVYAQDHMPLKPTDRICSFLPMAHIYGQLFEFIFPFSIGCHTTFLGKMPAPQLLTKAFGEIKPQLILSVPLILEKIFKKRIAPSLDKTGAKILLKVPLLRNIVYKKVHDQLTESFGGKFFEIVIGGAPLNKDVENFLRKAKFQFTNGYGMTECGPLISYAPWNKIRPYSAGKLVDRMKVKIDSNDPYNEVGEILVKGENVMMGYYKDETHTKEAIDKEGWLRTGDLGLIDKDNYIYIKGRSKNMILGSNGKNIYPEEIESKIDTLPIVMESLVVQRNEHLVALIFPDHDAMKIENIEPNALEAYLDEQRRLVNKKLPRFLQVQKYEVQDREFEKTPKKSIKRFMYN